MNLVDDTKNRNIGKNPYLHQNIIVDGKSFQMRSREPLILNKGVSIVIINDKGEIVAQASNEWGATLLVVAREYRKRGLGEILGNMWGKWNPLFTSGGFTEKGRATAEAIWETHVRDVRAKGGYSHLLKQGLITKDRINEIFSGLTRKHRRATLKAPRPSKPTLRKIRILIEKNRDDRGVYWGPMFIIYDEIYLHTLDDKYIYGFGFFRDSNIGSFLFTIDYDEGFREITTYVALQIARNNRESIYVGKGYGDLVEYEDLDHVDKKDDYIYLTEDVIDLEHLRRTELQNRLDNDSYEEKYYQLVEAANSKWS